MYWRLGLGGEVKALLELYLSCPRFSVSQEGVMHRWSPIHHREHQEQLRAFLSRGPFFIADGHHRWQAVRQVGLSHYLVYISAQDDPSLYIAPTHRFLQVEEAEVLRQLEPYFELRVAAARIPLWAEVQGLRHAIGVVAPGGRSWTARLRPAFWSYLHTQPLVHWLHAWVLSAYPAAQIAFSREPGPLVEAATRGEGWAFLLPPLELPYMLRLPSRARPCLLRLPTFSRKSSAVYVSTMQVILVSASPRRRALLELLGWKVQVQPTQVSEAGLEYLAPPQQAMALAARKVAALPTPLPEGTLAIAADTLVVHAGTVLGKPTSPEEAAQFLRRLSGTWHSVYTGVALATAERLWLFYEHTAVRFHTLPPALIERYIASGAPFDKAGGYGAQDLIGVAGIAEIHGDFYNVMGLPVQKLVQYIHAIFGAV